MRSKVHKMGKSKIKKREGVYRWKCRVCGKELISLYERQIEQWIDQHLYTHAKEQEAEIGKEKELLYGRGNKST